MVLMEFKPGHYHLAYYHSFGPGYNWQIHDRDWLSFPIFGEIEANKKVVNYILLKSHVTSSVEQGEKLIY